MTRRSVRAPVVRLGADGSTVGRDELAVEEPLEIRVDGVTAASTMRTPGDDFALAVGWALAEGLIDGPDDVDTVRYCTADGPGPYQGDYNVVHLSTRTRRAVPMRLGAGTSACGVCGSDLIEDVVDRAARNRVTRQATPADDVLVELPDRARNAQALFGRTGGVHGAAWFDADGRLLHLSEDVGRHNAVDKAVGWLVLEQRLPASGLVLFVSGRAAFEIVAKAAAAGAGTVVAVSAPTALAVTLARRCGVRLVGFVRDGTANAYTD